MDHKILVVIDDEPEMEDIYSLILEPLIKGGLVTVKFFEDGRTFLKWFENNTPDLIFCDINMPYMDGIAVCRKVRDSGRSVQIALISGDHPREHVEDMGELEIHHYVSKPVSPREVLHLCEEQIGLLQVNP